MPANVWLSHAHLLLQLGGKAGADGGANVLVSIAAPAAATVLSSSRVWLGQKTGYRQGAKPWEWWCGLTPVGSEAPHSRLLAPQPRWDVGENWKGKSEKTCGLR